MKDLTKSILLKAFVLFAFSSYSQDTKKLTFQVKKPPTESAKIVLEEPLYLSAVETMPMFPGGDEALYKFLKLNIKYPDEALYRNLKGTVFVSFIVGLDGMLSDIRVEKGIDPILDNEALRIFKLMPKWRPGMQKGRIVKIRINIPVKFENK